MYQCGIPWFKSVDRGPSILSAHQLTNLPAPFWELHRRWPCAWSFFATYTWLRTRTPTAEKYVLVARNQITKFLLADIVIYYLSNRRSCWWWKLSLPTRPGSRIFSVCLGQTSRPKNCFLPLDIYDICLTFLWVDTQNFCAQQCAGRRERQHLPWTLAWLGRKWIPGPLHDTLQSLCTHCWPATLAPFY